MNMPGPLPKRVLILGMGWSGRVLAARLQAQGVHVEGTVRDPASAPDDGLLRHQLRADAVLAPSLVAAIAHADAVLERARKAAAFGCNEREMRRRARRIVVRTESQVLVHAIGIDQLAGVHFAARVPDAFEFAECLHQLRAEHGRQELGLGLAVAVLPRQRAAVFDDQFRGCVEKVAPRRDAFAAA